MVVVGRLLGGDVPFAASGGRGGSPGGPLIYGSMSPGLRLIPVAKLREWLTAAIDAQSATLRRRR